MQLLSASLKVVGFAVLAMMLVAICYASFMSVKHWPGIAV